MPNAKNQTYNQPLEEAPVKAAEAVTSKESIKDSVNDAIAQGDQGASNKSFLDTIYEKITDVIGGDNPNQYFCLSLPGTIINPEDYTYEGPDKPAHVKANESKLVNKLFDASFVTAADNGRLLSDQYRTALNMLSPKLNRDLFEMKIRLREILMTPYQYDFGDGVEEEMTLEQVFYRLYSEYVAAKAQWNQKQVDKKAELKRSIIDPNERKDAYLEWYGLVAEAERVNLEEKLGKVLNVFSPGDMNIINAILNCSVGGEVESARSAMEMVEELSPEGGYVYPVNLYPSNWFKLLDTSFTGVDLLESPAALSQRMKNLHLQRNNIMLNISKLTTMIPDEGEVQELRKQYDEMEAKFHSLVDECVKKNITATVDTAKSILALCSKESDGKTLHIPGTNEIDRVIPEGELGEGTGSDAQKKREDKIQELIDVLGKNGVECYDSQTKAVGAAVRSADAALKWCETNNKLQLKGLLQPLQVQLENINDEIEDLKDQIAISKSVLSDGSGNNVGDVLPNKVDNGYTQVLIQSTMSSANTKSSKEASSSNSSWGVSFFLGGYSCNRSHQEAVESSMSSESQIDVQIGMNIAKVTIERQWFNPGVFQLTDNMYNFSANKIASENDTSFADSNTDLVMERFRDMNECILPSYPVAFVIAKDVTIRFTSQSSMSADFARSVEDHASQGGGFLIFSGNSSSASSSSQSAATANSTANSITVRFTEPQILGYYMQATPADKSIHINSTSDNDMSIITFVSKFKTMIEDYNRNIRKQG